MTLTQFMSSCSNQYTEEIKEVEEMQVILDGVKQSYNNIDAEKVTFAMESYIKNMDQIKNYYKPDTIDSKVTDLIDFYQGIKFIAIGFDEEYKEIGLNIEFLDKQLKTLKDDMDNNADFNDSLQIFIENEEENLELLNQNVATLLFNYEYVVSIHDSIATKVQNILLQNVE